jgi:uncharacterized membrane protein SpoIIM required for sporulation
MREGMFIKRNVERWNSYQHNKTTDEMAGRFVSLVDDLSYAKTFYPQSKVTRWINAIAADIYQSIYRNKKEKYSRIFHFWKYELPLLIKKHHPVMLFTFIVFAIIVAIGIFGSVKEEGFIRGILGDGYVEMTENNISKGDPFGVYKDDHPFSMFVRIALNNIFVALLMVAGGLTLGVVTLWSMWNNGLMLGSFQYMFFSKQLGYQSVMVIWIHGTLEILALVIASAAGLIMARGILFPGTYSRLVSFKAGVKDAVKIMIVLVPIFIVAAFFESYVTHLMSSTFDQNQKNTYLPTWAGMLILIFSFLFIVWYFIVWPILLHKKNNRCL